MKPKVIILSGYGLNCEDETAYAFNLALRQSSGSTTGGNATIVHVNDLVATPKMLDKYQILAIPGGFSYGDDTGSGKAYANKLKNHLSDALNKFAQSDKLIIGICNGFQILTQAGILPGALTFNDNARYTDRWADLKTIGSSPWLNNINHLSLPIAHGEGKFYADKKTLTSLQKNKQVAFTYFKGEISKMQGLPPNPNGSLLDIAAITGYNGRVLGIMPHPERAMFFNQLPHWTLLKEQMMREGAKIPAYGPGLQIFKNAVNYFNI